MQEAEMKRTTERLRIYGIVQGVGFRPTMKNLADASGITGTVCNFGPYVEIMATGETLIVDLFVHAIKEDSPTRAEILKIERKELPLREYPDFSIIESEKAEGEIFIPPDIAICEDCEKELFDTKDKRYLHPFINCTQCGPRLTIIDSLPYDRVRTSMKDFPFCPTCKDEYESPISRRFDAQPVCCPDCGPQVYLLEKKQEEFAKTANRDTAIRRAREILHAGGIVLVKGIGGFHLACDAGNEEAVKRLRKLKLRPVKPFGVMVRSLADAKDLCQINAAEEEILTGHRKPILLLERKETGSIAASVSPGNPKLGIMLPYTPLHHLLFRNPDGLGEIKSLVMTSGNVSGAPICRDDEEAVSRLGTFCDAILSHNREIRTRCDDSVVEIYEKKPYMVRRSRGYAPLPIMTDWGKDISILAIGGELKNTFCMGRSGLFYPSSYIGDMADVQSVQVLRETVARFSGFLETEPEIIACDLHPGYHTTEIAKSLAEEKQVPLFPVQHHFAHIASCMAENLYDKPVIGIALDGTGYGTDETIWGGEILVGDFLGFERVSHIQPFLQVGGDLASREGWRIAVSMLYGLLEEGALPGESEESVPFLAERLSLCDSANAKVIAKMRQNRINAAISTSCGRLFDAVAAMLGICRESSFEGEAATKLQFAALRAKTRMEKQEKLDLDAEGAVPTNRLFGYLLKERLAGRDVEELAYLFHDLLCEGILQKIKQIKEKTGLETVALSGGCFQNTLLLDLMKKKLEAASFRVLYHHKVPPNDGGIALGQAVMAAVAMEKGENTCVSDYRQRL